MDHISKGTIPTVPNSDTEECLITPRTEEETARKRYACSLYVCRRNSVACKHLIAVPVPQSMSHLAEALPAGRDPPKAKSNSWGTYNAHY